MVPLEPHYKGRYIFGNLPNLVIMASKIYANTSLNISKIIDEKKLSSDAEFARVVGVTPQTVSKWRSRNTYDITKIVNAFPDISVPWLLSGEGSMFTQEIRIEIVDAQSGETIGNTEAPVGRRSHRIESNVRPVLEGEMEWIEVPLMPYKARAGVLAGFGDPDWREGKQTMHVLVDRRLRGDYLIYEVEGDSMDNGTTNSFLEGDFLLCRVLPKSDWQYGIKKRTMTFCVIATEAEGVVLKQVTRHDKAAGVITCHSLNPAYDDYEVNLSDVQAIFYVERLAQRNL